MKDEVKPATFILPPSSFILSFLPSTISLTLGQLKALGGRLIEQRVFAGIGDGDVCEHRITGHVRKNLNPPGAGINDLDILKRHPAQREAALQLNPGEGRAINQQ